MDTQKILNDVGHRLYPVAKGPWVMTQAWNELLFAHWPLLARNIALVTTTSLNT